MATPGDPHVSFKEPVEEDAKKGKGKISRRTSPVRESDTDSSSGSGRDSDSFLGEVAVGDPYSVAFVVLFGVVLFAVGIANIRFLGSLGAVCMVQASMCVMVSLLISDRGRIFEGDTSTFLALLAVFALFFGLLVAMHHRHAADTPTSISSIIPPHLVLVCMDHLHNASACCESLKPLVYFANEVCGILPDPVKRALPDYRATLATAKESDVVRNAQRSYRGSNWTLQDSGFDFGNVASFCTGDANVFHAALSMCQYARDVGWIFERATLRWIQTKPDL